MSISSSLRLNQHRQPRIRRRSAIGVAALVAACALTATPLKSAAAQSALDNFGFDVSGMDRAVRPGDDFYAFANGGWSNRTKIPNDRSSYGVFATLDMISDQRVTSILEDAQKRPDDKAGAFYKSYLDTAAIETKGVVPLLPSLRGIDAASDKVMLARIMGRLQRQGISGVEDVEITADPKNPTSYIARLHQSGIALPDRDYYLKSDGEFAKARTAYLAYMTRMLTLAGRTDAAARAAAVLAFETRLAKVQWNDVAKRDVDGTYNRWAISNFTARAQGLGWRAYLSELGLASQSVLVVNEPSALSGTATAWSETPLAVLKDWLLLSTLDKYAPYLSSAFATAHFDFFQKTLSGTPQMSDRRKRAAHLVSWRMRDAVDQEYAARFFPPESRAAVEEIVRNILQAYRARINGADWLSPDTREKALTKLDRIEILIGYPAKWRDYHNLSIDAHDLVGNVEHSEEFEYRYENARLGRPVDRSDWLLPVTTTGGWANPVLVQNAFPAALLQAPVFDPHADRAVNYGAIGAIIGHEVSHLFDDQGRKYDASGQATSWWQPDEIRQYEIRIGELRAQYDGYSPLPGIHINGSATLGENVADLMGLQVALDGYHLSLDGKPAPIIDGWSGDQRFFLGFAQMQRDKQREAALCNQVVSDVHVPAELRVDEIRNLDAWYNAFDVKSGERLFLPPDKRVEVW